MFFLSADKGGNKFYRMSRVFSNRNSEPNRIVREPFFVCRLDLGGGESVVAGRGDREWRIAP
jgi:hypothetical protein